MSDLKKRLCRNLRSVGLDAEPEFIWVQVGYWRSKGGKHGAACRGAYNVKACIPLIAFSRAPFSIYSYDTLTKCAMKPISIHHNHHDIGNDFEVSTD